LKYLRQYCQNLLDVLANVQDPDDREGNQTTWTLDLDEVSSDLNYLAIVIQDIEKSKRQMVNTERAILKPSRMNIIKVQNECLHFGIRG
jgi:hypothetical protein